MSPTNEFGPNVQSFDAKGDKLDYSALSTWPESPPSQPIIIQSDPSGRTTLLNYPNLQAPTQGEFLNATKKLGTELEYVESRPLDPDVKSTAAAIADTPKFHDTSGPYVTAPADTRELQAALDNKAEGARDAARSSLTDQLLPIEARSNAEMAKDEEAFREFEIHNAKNDLTFKLTHPGFSMADEIPVEDQ